MGGFERLCRNYLGLAEYLNKPCIRRRREGYNVLSARRVWEIGEKPCTWR